MATSSVSCLQHLAGWQTYLHFDPHSAQAGIDATFDPDTLCLTWRVQGPLPQCQPVDLPGWIHTPVPGPFDSEQWQRSLTAAGSRQQFPR